MRVSSQAVVFALLVAGCGSRTALDLAEPASEPADAAREAIADAGRVDAPHDAAADASIDAGVDARADASVDASVDAPGDATIDAPVDAPPLCDWKGLAPEVTYPFGSPSSEHPTWIAAGDFDRDGHVDLAATGDVSDELLAVYVNKGDGTFKTAVAYASGPWPNDIAATDLDGDGFVDLLVANGQPNHCSGPGCEGAIAFLRNRGDGTFAAATSFSTGAWFVETIAVGDINGDRRPDVVVRHNGGSIGVLLNQGNGKLGSATLYPIGAAGRPVLADLDGDGALDLIAPIPSIDVGKFVTMFNDGAGKLTLAATYVTPGASSSGYQVVTPLAVGDFDHTGHVAVVAADMIGGPRVLVYPNPGSGALASPTPTVMSNLIQGHLTTADFDRDGRLDVAAPTIRRPQLDSFVTLLLGQGGGALAAPIDFPAFLPEGGFLAADLNGDGYPDVAHGGPSWISVHLAGCK